jgi:hypothetical protein
VRFSFDEPEFAMIDTLFSLAEAHLFMQLVELKEERPDLLPPGKDFATMYRQEGLVLQPQLCWADSGPVWCSVDWPFQSRSVSTNDHVSCGSYEAIRRL